jgi:type IX secretion system PorP/SprF family membrane protein
MKKFICILSIVSSCVYAQDIHFTQIQYFPLTLNPAMSGANYALSGNAIYRNQWKSVAIPYKTIGVSVDGRLKKSPQGHLFAAGLKFFNDNSGDMQLKTNDISLNVAYHLNIQKLHKIGFGICAGIIQRSINTGNAQWGNQYNFSTGTYDNTLPSNEQFNASNSIVPDLGAGIVYTFIKNEKYMTGNNNLRLNIGFSSFHLNRPSATFLKNSKDKLYMRHVIFANGEFGIPNSNFSIVPLLVVQLQGPSTELLTGAYIKYMIQDKSHYTGLKKGTSFSLGSIYRNKDAVSTNFVVEYDSYAIGASYDFNISQLKSVSKSRGAVEIFLRFVLPNPFGPDNSKSRI